MPYIAIRCYPKDEETKSKVVDEINAVFLKYWGCPPEAVTVSLEEVKPEDWDDKVVKPLIEPAGEHLRIRNGRKLR
ncbi:MAG: tautomerase family protein [Clostridia bacterium]|nr:tautomerase family protein [Clostridia bacterium]